jgi:adenylate cyclase
MKSQIAASGPDAALIDAEVNRVLSRGCLYSAALAGLSAPMIWLTMKLGFVTDLTLPVYWAVLAAIISYAVHWLARLGLVRGRIAWLAMFALLLIPGLLFGMATLLLPSGAATYITGPASYSYFFVITLSGLMFNARLSNACGWFAAFQYMAFFALDGAHLKQLSAPDLALVQDITEAPIYLFKASMMVFTGMMAALLGRTARRLISLSLDHEREKTAISRLFGQFVSPEVKDKILRERGAVAGERKDIAILFCDLRGFSSLSETMSPEDMVVQLNEYFDRMATAIESEGGVIDKFIGDAVMAVFGGVLDLANPCECAINAARKMSGILELLNAERAARGLAPLANGIGVHYGPALIGAIGSAERKDFTAIGDSVNIASRLEGLCKTYDAPVILSAEVAERLGAENRLRLRPLGETQVKGRSAPVRVFALVEPSVAPS